MTDPVQPPEAPASVAGLAQEIIKDSAAALEGAGPAPAAGPAAQPAAQPGAGLDLVDAWGRKADPALHLTNKKGEFSVHPRTGRLMCLPGKSLTGRPVKAAPTAPSAAAGNLDLPEVVEIKGRGPMDADWVDEMKTPSEQPPAFDPQQARLDAEAGAEIITDLSEMLGRWLAGERAEPTEAEASSRKRRWSRWMEANQLSVPFALFAQAAVGEGKYLLRVFKLPEAREKISDTWRKLRGLPPLNPKQADGKPAAPPPPAPVAGGDPKTPPLSPDQLSNF